MNAPVHGLQKLSDIQRRDITPMLTMDGSQQSLRSVVPVLVALLKKVGIESCLFVYITPSQFNTFLIQKS
jgi:hypothetical protein